MFRGGAVLYVGVCVCIGCNVHVQLGVWLCVFVCARMLV